MSALPPSDRTRLIVLFGGRSAEHDVSCTSAANVIGAADRDRFDIIPIGISRKGEWFRNDDALALLESAKPLPTSLVAEGTPITIGEVLATDRPTVVFPLLHGPHGEDGSIQGFLEVLDIPCVGSGVLGSALCMDKAMAKVAAAQLGIPQCRWVEHRAGTETPDELATRTVDELGFPIFVKPANMGSSVGVSRADDVESLHIAIATALRYDDVLVLEEGVTAREIEVAVLGNRTPEASLPGEIEVGAAFYDYADKYINGQANLSIPARLSDDETAKVRELAVHAFLGLRCAGLARVDFFYEGDDDNGPGRGWLLNEINTLPGFTSISMYPKMWEATGLSYRDLITRLIELALERHTQRSSFSTDL